MRLRELAERTGAAIPSIKFWIREGILPAGTLRNQTTAVYDDRHVERIALIVTLRDDFALPIAGIRDLTAVIDSPHEPLVHVMERCQVIATGISADGVIAARESGHASRVDEVIENVGWPDVPSVARDALAAALRHAEDIGVEFDAEGLTRQAEALRAIAIADLASIRPEGTRDAVARNLLLGAAAQNRVLTAMNQLAHASAALALRPRPSASSAPTGTTRAAADGGPRP